MNRLGCVADDFTGATDLAATLVGRGYRTSVVFDPGRLDPRSVDDSDAVVVALKTRTAPVQDAVAESVDATRWLGRAGCDRYYVKYCSTFDSTPTGNIGPVIDALLEELDLPLAVVAPSYPANGRTVYQGHLFVWHELLDESPMRHHPLTPMTDSRIERLLRPQTVHEISHVYLSEIRAGREHLAAALAGTAGRPSETGRRIVVADGIDDDDMLAVCRAAPESALLTGGAALALGLTPHRGAAEPEAIVPVAGGRLVLCGSASAQSHRQVAHATGHLASRRVDAARLATDPGGEVDDLVAWVRAQWAARLDRPVLVYASGSRQQVAESSGGAATAELIERALGQVAAALLDHGLTQLIVAGGETSGRVVKDLGITRLTIGQEIATGVVWSAATTGGGRRVSLALKSGNFGSDEMFTDAWKRLG